MYPLLLQHPPIPTYGVCLVLGLIIAWLLARRLARRAGVDASHIDLLVPLLITSGVLGAWLAGLLTDQLTADPVHGRVLFGSLLLATTVGIAYALAARIPLGRLGDIMAAPVCIGIAFGRIGCFFAGCCYGDVCTNPTPLTAIRFPHGSFAFNAQLAAGRLLPEAAASLPIYPVQLYEAAACLLLALLIYRRLPRGAIFGERFLLLGIGYPLLRFFLEFLRADNPPIVGPLTFSQLTALLTATLALTTLILRRRLAPRLHLLPA